MWLSDEPPTGPVDLLADDQVLTQYGTISYFKNDPGNYWGLSMEIGELTVPEIMQRMGMGRPPTPSDLVRHITAGILHMAGFRVFETRRRGHVTVMYSVEAIRPWPPDVQKSFDQCFQEYAEAGRP